MRYGFVLALAALFSTSAFAEESARWLDLVRKLHSEDTAQSSLALEQLRAIPRLAGQLRSSLDGAHRAEALFAISRLGLEELVPDLIASAKQNVPSADTILCLNRFLQSKSKKEITGLYFTWLAKDGVSSDVLLAISDGLYRAGERLSPAALRKLLGAESYELRIEAVRLAGSYLTGQSPDALYLPILGDATRHAPFQLRIEAFHWIGRLKEPQRSALGIQPDVCVSESNAEVASLCRKALGSE